MMWLARGFMWKQAGIPVEMAIPEEGALPILFEAGVPKNSRAKESAFKYLNAMLDPQAQVAFARKMGYVPTVKDAKLPEDLAKQISLTEASRPSCPDRLRDDAGAAGGVQRFLDKEFKG